jgi:hypothetical protein
MRLEWWQYSTANEEFWILYPQGDWDCVIQSVTSLSSSATVRGHNLNLPLEMIVPAQKCIDNFSLFERLRTEIPS